MKKCTSIIMLVILFGCKSHNNNPTQEVTFFSNGKVSAINNYVNDSMDGQQLEFDSSGYLKNQAHYKKGVIDGEAFYYYPNGLIKQNRTWRNNKECGFGDDYWPFRPLELKVYYWFNNDTVQYYQYYNTRGFEVKKWGINPNPGDLKKVYDSSFMK